MDTTEWGYNLIIKSTSNTQWRGITVNKYHPGIQEILMLQICLLIPVSQGSVIRSSWKSLEGGGGPAGGLPRTRLDLCWAIPGGQTPG